MRGRILKDANSGTGLISSGGQQYEFQIAGLWRSDVAPITNMVVEFEVDGNNKITVIRAVSEADLAREQAEKAMSAVKEKGAAALMDISGRVGKPVLIAVAVLIIGWFFLPALKFQADSLVMKTTFWQMLGIVNADGNVVESLQQHLGYDKGIFGIAAILAIIGPFASQFTKNPMAHLANCIALLLMVVVGYYMYEGINAVGVNMHSMTDAFLGPRPAGSISNQIIEGMIEATWAAIHIGPGAIAAGVASLYLFFVGIRKYLAAGASRAVLN